MARLFVWFLIIAAGFVPAHGAGNGARFSLCAERWQRNCVVDGDTLYVGGVDIRLIDIDAPEISKPNCAGELALGEKATARLLELLNAADVTLQRQGRRDHDRYGRKLRLVLVDGVSAGQILISEGLAAKWEGHHHRWCD